jgi:hypothetical protein
VNAPCAMRMRHPGRLIGAGGRPVN